jgi:hypothetical protein
MSRKVIIYFSADLDFVNYPNIMRHLSLYKEKLENRVETKNGTIPYLSGARGLPLNRVAVSQSSGLRVANPPNRKTSTN